jgi:hypothetical protein
MLAGVLMSELKLRPTNFGVFPQAVLFAAFRVESSGLVKRIVDGMGIG